jgi:entericidin B
LFTLVVLATVAATLSACNTVGGAGEDISAGGKAITDTADKVGDKL